MRECHRDVEAAALTAGERAALAVEQLGEVQVAGQLGRARRCLRFRQAVQAALGDQFLPYGDLRVHPAGLGHVPAHPAHPGGIGREVVAGDGGRAAGGFEQGREHPERGGLPGAVGAEEAEDLTLADGQIDTAHGFHGAAPGSGRYGRARPY
ncbi:hypothetical protein RKD46_002881 [Streptomyces pseudovenezuelae]